jgi:hypothetical protein
MKQNIVIAMEGSNIQKYTAYIRKIYGGNFHTWNFGLMLLMRNFNLQRIILGEEHLPLEVNHL